MDKGLNREILRLSVPSILANLTVPLVGMVDTAVAGHLQGGEAAAMIGAISVGAMLFNLLYWNFAFLRTGTGGLAAQAFGRGDMHDCAAIFWRAICVAAACSALILALQWPFCKLMMLATDASARVEQLACQYFFIRIWAAPATISLMAFSGWFVGMQDSVSSMWKDLVVNAVNIAASVILALGVGSWPGLGFAGVALGTVIAQYAGLVYCILVCVFKYRSRVFAHFSLRKLRETLSPSALRPFMKMNANLFGRSVFFTGIYIGYTMIAARYGDTALACSAIMMQILLIFSYFTDGFAYAGEALTGRFIGAKDNLMLRRTVKYVFVWSMSIAVVFIGIYQLTGTPLLRLLTSDSDVVEACRTYLPWLLLMPPAGCAAFTWDGIYLGATVSRALRNSMAGAFVAFTGVWLALRLILQPGSAAAMHCLLAAYFAHLLFRTVYLSIRYRRDVLSTEK